MKKLILFSALALACLSLASQELKFSDFNNGAKPKGTFTSYVCQDGTIFKVDELIKIGDPASGYDQFSYIWVGDGLINQDQLLGKEYSNTVTKLNRIVIGGTKNSGYRAYLRTRAPEGRILPYIILAEKAYQTGEILAPESKQ